MTRPPGWARARTCCGRGVAARRSLASPLLATFPVLATCLVLATILVQGGVAAAAWAGPLAEASTSPVSERPGQEPPGQEQPGRGQPGRDGTGAGAVPPVELAQRDVSAEGAPDQRGAGWRDDADDEGAPPPAWGRSGRTARPVDGEERPVELLRIDDPDERALALERAGWQTSGLEFRPGNATWGLVALTGGFLVHGAGHQGVGEVATARRLLAGQAVAAGLMGVGLVLRAVSPGADGTQALGGAALAAGGGMYVAGWLADVVGTFKGTAVPLPDNALDLRGVALEVFYTSLFAQNLSLTSVGVARVRVELDRVSLVPEVQFGPSASYWRYGTDVAARFALPPSRHELVSRRQGGALAALGRSHWGPWLQVHEDHHQADGWGQDVVAGGLELSFDLGRIDTNLHGLVWDLRVGVGGLWTFLEQEGNRRLRGRNGRAFIPVETAVSMNVSRGLNVALGYRHRPDHLAGGLWLDGGMFYQRFTIVPVERLGIEVTFEEGEFVRLWAGLRYYLSTQTRGL